MLQTWRKPAKVFSDFNTVQFAGVMGMVVFVMLLSFMTAPTGHHGGISTIWRRWITPFPCPGPTEKTP
jgi:hypothetical protein